MPRLPKHHMMVDVAVLAASDSEEDLQRDAKVLLSQPHIRSVAVFEPRGVGLDESRAGVRHVAGDPNLEIIYKVRRGSHGSAHFPFQKWLLAGRPAGPSLQSTRLAVTTAQQDLDIRFGSYCIFPTDAC